MLGRALTGSATDAARAILGAVIVRDSPEGRVAIRITEAEAYGGVGEDPGSHAHRGPTPRNTSMFGPAGTAYVYFSYGMHWALNVSTGPAGRAGAVLIRAGEVVEGVEAARSRRNGARDRDLARGPARLAQALGVTGVDNGVNLLAADSSLRLEPGGPSASAEVLAGPRVGVSGDGAATPWRFWLSGEPTVSTYRAAVRRQRRK